MPASAREAPRARNAIAARRRDGFGRAAARPPGQDSARVLAENFPRHLVLERGRNGRAHRGLRHAPGGARIGLGQSPRSPAHKAGTAPPAPPSERGSSMRNSPASCSAATRPAGSSRLSSISRAAAAIMGASARARLTQSLVPLQWSARRMAARASARSLIGAAFMSDSAACRRTKHFPWPSAEPRECNNRQVDPIRRRLRPCTPARPNASVWRAKISLPSA